MADRGKTDPIRITISDSILDATSEDHNVLSGLQGEMAYVRLTIARCTVFGIVLAHEIALAENSIFKGHVGVAHRQTGCVRFCYVPPGSRTPRRYECQPDLVERPITDLFTQARFRRPNETANEKLRNCGSNRNSTAFATASLFTASYLPLAPKRSLAARRTNRKWVRFTIFINRNARPTCAPASTITHLPGWMPALSMQPRS